MLTRSAVRILITSTMAGVGAVGFVFLLIAAMFTARGEAVGLELWLWGAGAMLLGASSIADYGARLTGGWEALRADEWVVLWVMAIVTEVVIGLSLAGAVVVFVSFARGTA